MTVGAVYCQMKTTLPLTLVLPKTVQPTSNQALLVRLLYFQPYAEHQLAITMTTCTLSQEHSHGLTSTSHTAEPSAVQTTHLEATLAPGAAAMSQICSPS